MAKLPYIAVDEKMRGSGGASADTLNRALRGLLEQSGHDPDADPFPGIIPVYNVKPYITANANDGRAGVAAAATAAGIKGIYFPPGTTDIGSNLTISVPVQFAPGAKIRPAAGVVVTFTGPIMAGPHQIYDTSLQLTQQARGDCIDFAGNPFVREFPPEWWGALGDNTDQTVAWQAMLTAVPNYARVRVPTGAKYKFSSTVVLKGEAGLGGKVGVVIDSGIYAGYAESQAPEFIWTGAAGGIMFALDRTRACEVSGIKWTPGTGGAKRCIVTDGYSTTNYLGVDDGVSLGIGSINRFYRNTFGNSGGADFAAVGISEYVINNQEYHVFGFNNFNGSAEWVSFTATIDGGALGTVVGSNFLGGQTFTAGDVGKRIRVAGAGPSGGVLDTTIASFVDATHVTLTDVATAAVTNVRGMKGESIGDGVLIGNSSNAKTIIFHDNQFNNCRYGLNAIGGSFLLERNSMAGNEVNVLVGNMADVSYEYGTNSEHSRQHFASTVGLAVQTYWAQSGRYDVENAFTNYIEHNAANGIVEFKHCTTEGILPQGGFLADAAARGHLRLDQWRLGGSSNMPESQIARTPANVEFSRFEGIVSATDWRARRYRDGLAVTGLGYLGLTGGIIRGVVEGTDGSVSAAVEGIARSVTGLGSSQDHVAVRGVAGDASGGFNNYARYIAFDAILTEDDDVGGYTEYAHGVRVRPPTLTNGAQVANARGVTIEPLKVTGVGNVKAIDQQGPNDPNQFAGPVTTAARRVGVNVVSSTNYTPDAALYEVHRIAASANLTVNAPTGMVEGSVLTLDIANESAGAITVTLNGAFKGSFTPPSAGNRSSRTYVYDAADAKWVPIGAQSEEFLA